MANARKQNVYVIDTTGQISDVCNIKSIKLVGNATDASTVTIKADSTSGAVVYSARAAQNADNFDSEVCMNLQNGMYVTLTGTGPVCYIYLK